MLLVTSLSFAQKEKTLFWEISGNGLTKKSYLYGTMHVNDKISYHLSDAFFKNLLASDIVSNESDPETWDEVIALMQQNNLYSPYNFYATFYLNPIKKNAIKTVFINSNYFANMLSGVEGEKSDYQENTVLDMFIYQTGRKYKKRIIGLESATESMLSIMKIKQDDARPDDKNRELLLKIVKSGNFNEATKDYYREKDVLMLDSIYKLMFSKKAHDALIVNRNIIMTKSIDSLAKTGSLFSAVGAAHLAGKQGIIQLLRDKGYTVSPIIDVMSKSGEAQKKAIEDFYLNPGFTATSSKDNMIKMPLTNKIIKNGEDIGSPDFTNGGAISIKRIPLNSFMNKKDELFNPKTIDSLFFENIPGTILEKNYFEQDNYVGYDIKNATKNGNNQHWRFYITPLELITVSMIGNGNYTRQFEKEVFDNIKIKSFSNNWQRITPLKGGFSVEVPEFNMVYGNTDEAVKNVEIQAYNSSEKGYYFVTESTLNSTNFLEDSEFEQKQIHYEFYLQHDADSTNTKFDKIKQVFTSQSKIGNKNVKLKSVIKGTKYYLLGTINASNENSTKFFESFKEEKFNYKTPYTTYTDTVSKFKIDVPKKQNEALFLDIPDFNYKSKNAFISKAESKSFNSASGKSVDLEFYKYHKYDHIDNLDSVKVYFKKMALNENLYENNDDEVDYNEEYDDYDEYDKITYTSLLNLNFNSKKGFSKSIWNDLVKDKEEKYEIISESSTFDKDTNTHFFNTIVSKPNATQAIKSKIIFTEDSYAELSTLVEREYKNDDDFIEKTFNSYLPIEKNTTSVFSDKIKLFIEDATNEKDTIRYSAMNSINELKIAKKDFETVTNFIDTFKFKDSEIDAAESLLLKIGKIEDSRVIPYLEKTYKKENVKTGIQFGVLNALTYQKSKLAYKKIMDLLEYDLPISTNEYDISSMFQLFEKDLENSKELFPKIYQYYSIKEYNEPIIKFCNKLLESNLVNPKKLSSFKKIITTNAKLEYKRVVSWKEKNPKEDVEDEDDSVEDQTVAVIEAATKAIEKEEDIEEEEVVEIISDSVSRFSNDIETAEAPVKDLINYINLMYSFQKDEAFLTLIEKIKKLEISQLDIELLRLDILNNRLSSSEIETALNNLKTRYITIQLLLNKNKTALYSTISDEKIAESAVYNFESLKDKDKISLLYKQNVNTNDKETIYYFFEIIRKVAKDEVEKKELYPIEFVVENSKINPIAYKVLTTKDINDDDVNLNKIYQSIITESLNEKHFRATFEKVKELEENYLYDEY